MQVIQGRILKTEVQKAWTVHLKSICLLEDYWSARESEAGDGREGKQHDWWR